MKFKIYENQFGLIYLEANLIKLTMGSDIIPGKLPSKQENQLALFTFLSLQPKFSKAFLNRSLL